jgi:hypothetical protein
MHVLLVTPHFVERVTVIPLILQPENESYIDKARIKKERNRNSMNQKMVLRSRRKIKERTQTQVCLLE